MPKDLGPEMFCSDDEKTINWKGDNYYKACGKPVAEYSDGSKSHCVKRLDHPSVFCEDYKGICS